MCVRDYARKLRGVHAASADYITPRPTGFWCGLPCGMIVSYSVQIMRYGQLKFGDFGQKKSSSSSSSSSDTVSTQT